MASLCSCHIRACALSSPLLYESSDGLRLYESTEDCLLYDILLSSPGVRIAEVTAVDVGRPQLSYSVFDRLVDLLEPPEGPS